MAKKKKNLSLHTDVLLEESDAIKIGILVSEWNKEITNAMSNEAIRVLKKNKIKKDNIVVKEVPGSFELPLAASLMAKTNYFDAIICIGCVIQGETRHFEFISQAVANGIMNVALQESIPVVFGVLTTDNMEQAEARSGGKHGNKGTEAAITALKMLNISHEITALESAFDDELLEDFTDIFGNIDNDDDDEKLPF